jgi:hypothetical protein
LRTHRKIAQQEATIAQEAKEISALTARPVGQASQMQKVSVRLELQKALAQTAFTKSCAH